LSAAWLLRLLRSAREVFGELAFGSMHVKNFLVSADVRQKWKDNVFFKLIQIVYLALRGLFLGRRRCYLCNYWNLVINNQSPHFFLSAFHASVESTVMRGERFGDDTKNLKRQGQKQIHHKQSTKKSMHMFLKESSARRLMRER
jgi:hypothetical protein